MTRTVDVSVEAIQQWLITRLAEQLGIKAQEIDVHTPFTEYGLDSLAGVCLVGDLEDWLGLQLVPTLLWDYSTIETLACHLTERVTVDPCAAEAQASLATPTGTDRDNTEDIVAQPRELSDEDMDALLHDLLASQV